MENGKIWQVGINVYAGRGQERPEASGQALPWPRMDDELGLAVATFRLAKEETGRIEGSSAKEGKALELALACWDQAKARLEEEGLFLRSQDSEEETGVIEGASGGGYAILTGVLPVLKLEEERERQRMGSVARILEEACGELGWGPVVLTLLGRGPFEGEFDGYAIEDRLEEAKLLALEEREALTGKSGSPQGLRRRGVGL